MGKYFPSSSCLRKFLLFRNYHYASKKLLHGGGIYFDVFVKKKYEFCDLYKQKNIYTQTDINFILHKINIIFMFEIDIGIDASQPLDKKSFL